MAFCIYIDNINIFFQKYEQIMIIMVDYLYEHNKKAMNGIVDQ